MKKTEVKNIYPQENHESQQHIQPMKVSKESIMPNQSNNAVSNHGSVNEPPNNKFKRQVKRVIEYHQPLNTDKQLSDEDDASLLSSASLRSVYSTISDLSASLPLNVPPIIPNNNFQLLPSENYTVYNNPLANCNAINANQEYNIRRHHSDQRPANKQTLYLSNNSEGYHRNQYNYSDDSNSSRSSLLRLMNEIIDYSTQSVQSYRREQSPIITNE